MGKTSVKDRVLDSPVIGRPQFGLRAILVVTAFIAVACLYLPLFSLFATALMLLVGTRARRKACSLQAWSINRIKYQCVFYLLCYFGSAGPVCGLLFLDRHDPIEAANVETLLDCAFAVYSPVLHLLDNDSMISEPVRAYVSGWVNVMEWTSRVAAS